MGTVMVRWRPGLIFVLLLLFLCHSVSAQTDSGTSGSTGSEGGNEPSEVGSLQTEGNPTQQAENGATQGNGTSQAETDTANQDGSEEVGGDNQQNTGTGGGEETQTTESENGQTGNGDPDTSNDQQTAERESHSNNGTSENAGGSETAGDENTEGTQTTGDGNSESTGDSQTSGGENPENMDGSNGDGSSENADDSQENSNTTSQTTGAFENTDGPQATSNGTSGSQTNAEENTRNTDESPTNGDETGENTGASQTNGEQNTENTENFEPNDDETGENTGAPQTNGEQNTENTENFEANDDETGENTGAPQTNGEQNTENTENSETNGDETSSSQTAGTDVSNSTDSETSGNEGVGNSENGNADGTSNSGSESGSEAGGTDATEVEETAPNEYIAKDGLYEESDILGDLECNTLLECREEYHEKSTCEKFTHPEQPPIMRCVCNKSYNFHRYEDTTECTFLAKIGEVCDIPRSICKDANTECRFGGSFGGINRCQCKDGYKKVKINGEYQCASILTPRQDQNCFRCEKNDATCYDLDGDETMEGCICPVSRTGPFCETIHVFVKCNMETFSMDVCYDPHEGIDFEAGSQMFTQYHLQDLDCRSKPASNNTCPRGKQFISLPLDDTLREECGTEVVQTDLDTIKYTNRLVVTQPDPMDVESGEIIFNTYCMFTTGLKTSFSGVGSQAVAYQSNVGTDYLPDLSFILENMYGDVLTEGTTLNLRDQYYMSVKLSPLDDVYEAIRVESCFLSSKAASSDPKAVVSPLLDNGCPAYGQRLMNVNNMFVRDGGNTHVLRAGPLSLVKVGGASTTFMHCAVKLCLKGESSDCAPYSCGSGLSSSRKRRAATQGDSKTVELSRGFSWEEEPLSDKNLPGSSQGNCHKS